MNVNKAEYLFFVLIAVICIGFSLVYHKLNYNSTQTELSILVIIFFAVIAFYIIRNLTKKGTDYYEIINPLLIIYSLYAMMLPLNYLIRTKYSTQYIDIPGIAVLPVFQYIIICMIGLVGLIIGYYLPFGEQCATKIPVLKLTLREFKIALIILLIFGFFSFATHVAGYGGFSNFIKVGYGEERYVIQREMLAFGRGLEIIGFACIVLMFAFLKEKTKKLGVYILLTLLLLWYLYISLLIGQRRYIIYIFTIAFILSNYGIARIKLKWSMLIVIVAFAFFLIYAHSRGVWAQLGLTKGIVATFNLAVKNPLLFLPFTGGEFLPPSKALLEVLTDNSLQFRYGSSYIIAIIRLIPRIAKIWPDALQTLTEWRMTTYYPGLHEKGVGYNFFTVAEGYINFGYIGVFLHMAFFGFIAKVIYSYFQQNRDNFLVLLIYSIIFCMILFEGIHAEFRQFIYYTIYSYLGPLFLIIFTQKLFTHASKRKYDR